MLTPFALLLDRCGLTHQEAADLLATRKDSVTSWANGRRTVPPSVVSELRIHYLQVERAASEALKLAVAEHPRAVAMELIVAPDDASARERGYGCRALQLAAYGLVVALSNKPVTLVEEGAAPAIKETRR